jgi:hypothetical protein
MENAIILSKMYCGEYIETNIGHEIINLFKADNGKNYIWVNDDGRINPLYDDAVCAVLLVRYVEEGVMEVIAKAEELEQVLRKTNDIIEESKSQVNYVENNGITYGGVYPYLIFGSSDAEKLVITYKADLLRKVREPIYLIEDIEKKAYYHKYIELPEKHFSKSSQRMYYSKENQPKDYAALEKLLNTQEYWETENSTQRVDTNDDSESSTYDDFVSIIKKENDELVYSNLLAYIFEQNRKVFSEFANSVLGISSFNTSFRVYREKDRVDLWIEDESTIFIIENKIKSKINGERHDIHGEKIQSQLSKYFKEAESKNPFKKVYGYVFAPDYNIINLDKYESGKQYKVVKYSQIYDFYMKHAGQMLKTRYFQEFVSAIRLHTMAKTDSNFEIMKSRFISKIKMLLAARVE